MREVILFQRISGGYEFRFSRIDGDEYVAWAPTAAQARAKLRRILGWDAAAFDRADFRKF